MKSSTQVEIQGYISSNHIFIVKKHLKKSYKFCNIIRFSLIQIFPHFGSRHHLFCSSPFLKVKFKRSLAKNLKYSVRFQAAISGLLTCCLQEIYSKRRISCSFDKAECHATCTFTFADCIVARGISAGSLLCLAWKGEMALSQYFFRTQPTLTLIAYEWKISIVCSLPSIALFFCWLQW
jgi:hypothetical protein